MGFHLSRLMQDLSISIHPPPSRAFLIRPEYRRKCAAQVGAVLLPFDQISTISLLIGAKGGKKTPFAKCLPSLLCDNSNSDAQWNSMGKKEWASFFGCLSLKGNPSSNKQFKKRGRNPLGNWAKVDGKKLPTPLLCE